MTFAKTRASFAVASGNNIDSAFATQILSVREQLEGGAGAFHLVLHDDPNPKSSPNSDLSSAGKRNNEPYLCYPNCTQIRGGYLADMLSIFATWLDENPSVVLTVFLDNASGVPPQLVSNSFSKAQLLRYAHPKLPTRRADATVSGGGWPTLGEMVEMNKRLVVFEERTQSLADVLPWVHSASASIYRLNQTPNYLSGKWECDPWRADASSFLVEIPHFANVSAKISNMIITDLPHFQNASYMNSEPYYKHFLDCKVSTGINWVNFMTVDFFGIGNIPDINSGLNNLNSSLNEFDFLPNFYSNKAPLLKDLVKYVSSGDKPKLSTQATNTVVVLFIEATVLLFISIFL